MHVLSEGSGEHTVQSCMHVVAFPMSSLLHAGKAREKACLQTLTVLHVPGDPLQKDDLDTKLDMTRSASHVPGCLFIDSILILTLESIQLVVHGLSTYTKNSRTRKKCAQD